MNILIMISGAMILIAGIVGLQKEASDSKQVVEIRAEAFSPQDKVIYLEMGDVPGLNTVTLGAKVYGYKPVERNFYRKFVQVSE